MQLGQQHRRVTGLGIVVIALVVAALAPYGDSTSQRPALRGIAAIIGSGQDTGPGGSLTATVSWPSGAAELSDICVVVFDADGGVADEVVGRLEPIPGESVAGRWTAEGLGTGRYTVYVAQCVTPAADTRARVEPQFLGGADDAEAASWVEVTSGDHVDVGTIALRRSGPDTWRTES